MRVQEVEPRAKFSLDTFNSEVIHALRKGISPILQKHIREEDRVVEIAAGTGRFGRVFPEVVGQVISLDRNSESLTISHAAEPNASLIKADIKSLPFGDASVDVFVGLASYEAINKGSLQETQRVLRPGGRMLLFQDVGLITDASLDDEAQKNQGRLGITKANLERKHQGIMKAATQLGFKVLDGYVSREAFYFEDLDKHLASLSAEDLERINKRISSGEGFLLGFVKAYNEVSLLSANPGEEKSILRFVERSEGVSWPRGMRLIPGKDYVEAVKFRYLVLQKQ